MPEKDDSQGIPAVVIGSAMVGDDFLLIGQAPDAPGRAPKMGRSSRRIRAK